MRQTWLAIGSIVCLAFVVHLRSAPVPPLPLAFVETTTSHLAELPVRHMETSAQSAPVGEDLCSGELPDETKELVTVLKQLHTTTIQSFEQSPRFGGNRGGFGGGQFGGAGGFGGGVITQQAKKPPREHSSIPKPFPVDGRRLHKNHASMKEYDPQWTWLEELSGVTGRGFVYKTDNRTVVGMPVEPDVNSFLNRVIASDPATDLGKDERVWDIAELQLIGLFMNPQPVVYDKHLMMSENHERPKTRALDDFEQESLKNLRAGAERVIAWSREENCLRVLGAIRTKDTCQKCHDANIGLLGAFSYRIRETTRGDHGSSAGHHRNVP
jgi:hypothetical protein